MAKHGKKQGEHTQDRKIIRLKDYQEIRPMAEELEEEPEAELEESRSAQQKKVPKAVYRVAAVLLVLVVVLALWMNRTSLSPENLWNWGKTQLMGEGGGEGYPVSILGSQVQPANFTAYQGGAVVLSDTALSFYGPAGEETLSLHHGLNQPVLCEAEGRYLLYNAGSTGYLTLAGTGTVAQGSGERPILAGAIAPNGKFALGVQGADGASELNVYQKDPDRQGEGQLQYHYLFAQDYITAIALNYDGTCGAACTVRSQGGEMVSRITVFDFGKSEPIATYETRNNLLLAAYWGENGTLYAVGDSALVRGESGAYEFTEYSYEGRQLTAYRLCSSRAFLSISAYEHAGPSTLLTFHGTGDPVALEMEDRIEAIAVSGGSAGLLVDGQVVFCDYSAGAELGRAEAGLDAHGLAMASESQAYVLGGSEVRKVTAP